MIDQEQVPDQRIVVGVDSSAGSAEALRWALAHARLTGATVEAVTAWQVPPMFAYAYGWTPTGIDDAGIIRYAEKTLAETVAQVQGEDDHPVPVTTRVLGGPAAQVLIEASKGAELMVLGSHGHGAFAGMLLGSVSQHCVEHATCPTVVIPK
ncbi:universal stress protein [Actinoplanes xinjiangensis]|uniref:Nucleotide-binding universal stress UspA family protein n=1 Tax=Actinoplanes xinjiangensis TaxID=512350 RepID=A0A316ELR2_9ACTN|nr:universal stress protein [Actinoplanes xinjiangensis]PWK32454.1 nucleotide-binding universal stress UspA family protein [Actinoplanes xinjiangensis]GIF45071.1 universal stress protein [Actinoplanes xinjiangensis]